MIELSPSAEIWIESSPRMIKDVAAQMLVGLLANNGLYYGNDGRMHYVYRARDALNQAAALLDIIHEDKDKEC